MKRPGIKRGPYGRENQLARLIRAAAGTAATAALLFVVVLLLVAIRLLLLLFLLFLFFDRLLANLSPALVERFLGEERIGGIGVEFTFLDEHLIDFLAVALAGHLKRLRDAANRMIVGIILGGLAAHARAGIASDHYFAQRQMRGLRESNANRAIVVVHKLDPVGFFQVHHVGAQVAQNRSRLFPAIAQHIVDINFYFFLERGDRNLVRIADSAAIEHPTLIAILNFDDVALRQIFAAIFVGELLVIDKIFVTHQLAAVAE